MCCIRIGSSTRRRLRSTPRCWIKARTTARFARCTEFCTIAERSASVAINCGIQTTRNPNCWRPGRIRSGHGTLPSCSGRPHVSNDNPFSESQFKTLKYRPEFPDRFGSQEDAHGFSRGFFAWYNDEHRRKRASGNRWFPEARCTIGGPSIRLSLARLRPRRAWLRFAGHAEATRIRSSATPTLGHPSHA